MLIVLSAIIGFAVGAFIEEIIDAFNDGVNSLKKLIDKFRG